jgi:hypothetical protein
MVLCVVTHVRLSRLRPLAHGLPAIQQGYRLIIQARNRSLWS